MRKYIRGLARRRFYIFKTEHLSDIDLRLIHFIYISTWRNIVDFSSIEERYHAFAEYPALDLSQIKISAEQALQTAEIEGGSKYRKDVGNDCRVLMSIETAGKYQGWSFRYLPNDPKNPSFRIIVNETAGKYIIIW